MPIIGHLLKLLKRLDSLRKVGSSNDDFLFPGRSGQGPINFRKSWNNALAAAGISDFHFHDTRHVVVSLLAELGYPLHVISLIVGHRSHTITATRYTHLNLEHAEVALECLGNAICDNL